MPYLVNAYFKVTANSGTFAASASEVCQAAPHRMQAPISLLAPVWSPVGTFRSFIGQTRTVARAIQAFPRSNLLPTLLFLHGLIHLRFLQCPVTNRVMGIT